MRLLLVEIGLRVGSGINLGLFDAGYVVDSVSSTERAEGVLQGETFDAAITATLNFGAPSSTLAIARRVPMANC